MKHVRYWFRRLFKKLLRRRRFVDGSLVNTPATVQELIDAINVHFATDSHPFYLSSATPAVWDYLDERSMNGWNVKLEADMNGDLYHVVYSVDHIHVKTIIRKNNN